MSPIVSVLDPLFLDSFERRQLAPISALATPFSTWNRHCRDDGGGVGLARGWNVTLGANPGDGKSLMALNIARCAMEAGARVGFVSLEMAPEQLAARLYAIVSGVPVAQVEKGSFSRERFRDVLDELRQLQGRAALQRGYADFLVNEEPLAGVSEVLSTMEGMRQEGASLFIVDYLQLALAGDGDDDGIYRETSVIANAMRRYAREHRVVVVGLSQFNRRTSADYSQPPRIQGLHGGMALEANSDQVLLLDHSAYQRDSVHPHLARTWLILGKNRHGGTGSVPIEWDYRTLRVREAQPDEEDLWPVSKGGR